jgi:hypothetical protein
MDATNISGKVKDKDSSLFDPKPPKISARKMDKWYYFV